MANPRQFARSELGESSPLLASMSAAGAVLHPIRVCLVLTLGLIAACSAKPAVQVEQAGTQVAAAKPVLSSTLDQIQNQYAADQVSARKKYQNVSVQFTSLAGDVTVSPTHDLTINFHTAQHPQPIRALFPASDNEAAPSAREGSMVQARCDSIVEVANRPELRGCKFR
jgi:hypothetical protein